ATQIASDFSIDTLDASGAGGNQSECKPCHPCDKRGGKRRRQINDNVGNRCVHRSLILLCASRDSRVDGVASCFRRTGHLSAMRPAPRQSKPSMRLTLGVLVKGSLKSTSWHAPLRSRKLPTAEESRGLILQRRRRTRARSALRYSPGAFA